MRTARPASGRTKPRSTLVTTTWTPGVNRSGTASPWSTGSRPHSARTCTARPAVPAPSAATTTVAPSAASLARWAARASPGASQPDAGSRATSGPSGTADTVTAGAVVWASSRSKGMWSWGKPVGESPSGPLSDSAPQVRARLAARSASSARRSVARSRIRRGSTSTTRPSGPSRSVRTRSPSRSRSTSHGNHDSIPSNSWPSASRCHCSTPQGSAAISPVARSRMSSVMSSSRQGKISSSARSTVDRWSAIVNSLRRSTSSPHRSIR